MYSGKKIDNKKVDEKIETTYNKRVFMFTSFSKL